MLDPLLYLWLTVCAEYYQVEPAFARAVMLVESGGRCGPLGKAGKFYGPFGIHRDFLKKWPIDNHFINIMIGVKSLQNTNTVTQKKRRLQKYNQTFNVAYFDSVMKLYRQNKGKGDAPKWK